MWSSAPRGCGAAHPNTDGTVLQIRWRFPPNPHFVCRDPIELQTPTVQSCCPLGSHRPEPFSVVSLFLLSFSLHTWGRGSQCHHCILGLQQRGGGGGVKTHLGAPPGLCLGRKECPHIPQQCHPCAHGCTSEGFLGCKRRWRGAGGGEKEQKGQKEEKKKRAKRVKRGGGGERKKEKNKGKKKEKKSHKSVSLGWGGSSPPGSILQLYGMAVGVCTAGGAVGHRDPQCGSFCRAAASVGWRW